MIDKISKIKWASLQSIQVCSKPCHGHKEMSVIGTIREDVTTEAVGEIGSWQWLVTFMSTALMTNSFFNHYEDILLVHPNKVFCVPGEPEDEVYNQTLCTYVLRNGTEYKCEKWQLKLFWIIWLKKSYLIFCDDEMKLLLTAVICRSATVFGYVIFGLVADSFGRRIAIIFNIFGSFGLRLVTTFCDSEGWFRLVLFLGSIFGKGNMIMGIIIVCEIASNSWRSWLTSIVISPRLIAMVSVVHMANGVSNAETFNLIGCFCCFFYVFILRWVPESPQWMLYNRKIPVAEKVLSKAAMTNRIHYSAEFKIRPVNQRAYYSLDEPTTCFRVWSIHNLRLIVCVSITFWGLFNFIWASLYLKVYSLGVESDLLLKVFGFLAGLTILTALSSSIFSMQRFLIINLILTAVLTAIVVIFEQLTMLRSTLSSLALASGLMVHALILNMTPRFYAVNLRATLFGCCHATGYIGAMISYIIFIYKCMDDITFAAVEVVISLVLIGLSFLMPNVDGRELPDVIDDMDYFTELTKPLRWATQKRTHPSKEEVELRLYSFDNGANVPSTSTHGHKLAPGQRPQRTGLQKLYSALRALIMHQNPAQVAPVEPISRPESIGIRVNDDSNATYFAVNNSIAATNVSVASPHSYARGFP